MVLPHVRGRLLDIGCGLNALVRSYSGEGIGVDVHQWGDVDLVVDDSASLPYRDGEFDTVTIVAALNHIPNRTDVLREAHRVLKVGGKIIVTMIPPPVGRLWHVLRGSWDADQRERGMKEGEVYGMTGSEIRLHLAQAGFRISYEQRFMLGFNRLTVATKPAEYPETQPVLG